MLQLDRACFVYFCRVGCFDRVHSTWIWKGDRKAHAGSEDRVGRESGSGVGNVAMDYCQGLLVLRSGG